jgi:hypothetical protein
VADEAAVLVSSANLTEYALNLNMELLACWCAEGTSRAASWGICGGW